jgi:hypothetical protein
MMTRTIVFLGLFVGLVVTGCATTHLDTSEPQDMHRMVGLWQGWLITPMSFTQINLDIRDDGSFDLTGDWGIQSAGTLMTSGKETWFNGSRGWRGILRPVDTARGPALDLELDDRLERATLRLVSR